MNSYATHAQYFRHGVLGLEPAREPVDLALADALPTDDGGGLERESSPARISFLAADAPPPDDEGSLAASSAESRLCATSRPQK